MNDHPAYSASEEETGHTHTKVDSGSVWRITAIAAGVSLVVNLILFFVGRSVGWIPEDMPESTEAFSLVSVILMSTIPVLLFGGLMQFLGNNAPRASRLFTIILLVVLLLGVMVPLLIRDIEGSFRFVLIAMHIVTASAIFSLTQTAKN